MNASIFTNSSLKKFIEGVNISAEKKSLLLSKLPQLDEEERIKLFNVSKETYLLDLEEKKALERVEKCWKK